MPNTQNELAKIKLDGDYLPTILISDDEDNNTNRISLSNENAKQIAEWLLKNFVDETPHNQVFPHEI